MFDLDPPELREVTYSAELDAYFCSRLFDPVGDDATSDGEAVAQLSEMRVRAIDRGNGALSVSDVILPTADLEPATVQMYILDDDSVPLLVDTNGDGQCDDINPVVVPAIVPMTSTEARVIDLFGINDTGSSHFAPPLVPYGSTPEVADGSCSEPPDSDPPLNLCISVELSRVIKNELLEEPAIYGIPPSSPLACLGNAFDSQASNISDGWACIAVIGEDKLGNRGVSAPLRVCFDHDGDGAECHALGTIEPDELLLPSCRSACTLPDRFADFPELNAIRIDL
jgi:hypothetical protein